MPPAPIRILAVDDEPDLCALTKEFLELPGEMWVDTACSVRDAKIALESKRYDIIISDYQMPGEDGIQFLKALRASGETLPFILFTGKGREEVVIEALNNGADFYIQKGGNPKAQYAELAHKVHHAVSRKRGESSLLASVNELREAASRYEVLIAASNTGAWEYHDDTGYLWCSPEYFSMLGRDIDHYDISGTRNIENSWIELLHPDDRAMAIRHFQDYLKDPKGMYDQYFRLLHQDGHWVWIWSRGKMLNDDEGNPTRITVGTHIDITERKLIEESLRNSENRFRLLIDSIIDPVIILGFDARVIYANNSMFNLLEIAPIKDFETIDMKKFLKAGSLLKAISDLDRVQQAKGLFKSEYEVVTPSGTKTVEAFGRMISWDGKMADLVSLRDVTEYRRTEKLLGAHLRISEYSQMHSVDELLKKTLDEAEEMTGSNIGFLHFVDDDQESLRLQMWSTNTLKVMCNAEGKGQHYNVSKAGVWVDCVKAKEPIVHNDVIALPHRKGFPQGHAPVKRELVVPVIRDGKVKAIFGVGNKETDYDREDVNIVRELASLVWDIAERKNAEQVLRESREQLNVTIESFGIGLWDWNVQTGEAVFNERWAAIVGYTLNELSPINIETWTSMVHPDDLKRSNELLAKHFAGETAYYECEARMKHHNGQWIWVLDRGKVTAWDNKGRPLRMSGTHLDITARKWAEEELRDNERIMHQAQEVSRVGHFVTDVTTGLWKSSPVLDEIFGIDGSFVRSIENWGTLMVPDHRQRMMDYYYKVIRERSRFDMDYKIIRPIDGQERWVSVLGEFDYDPSGNPIRQIGTVQDITERKRTDAYRDLIREILQILTQPGTMKDSFQHVLSALRTSTGVDAVGIRLRNGDDFPYYTQEGFSKDFILKENSLLDQGSAKVINNDEWGKPSLECMCGLVISGRTDASDPLFTRGGSAWTNDSFPFLDVPADEDLRIHPRNECMRQGYASIAWIPIRGNGQIVGLLQLNDHRKGRFTLEAIESLEVIVENIGGALSRKLAEEALRESEKRYRILIESASEAIVVLQDGRLRFVNPATVAMTEVSEKELTVTPFLEFIHPEDRAKVAENHIRRSRGEPAPNRYVFRFLRKDGVIRWVEISVVIIDWEGRPATLNFLTDITERKKMEQALSESEVRYRLLVESANEAIVVAQDGMLRFVNPATVALTGFSEPELISVPFIKRIHPEDRAMVAERYQKRARGEPVPDRYIFRLVTGKGITRWVEMNAVMIDWEGRLATLNFLTDITERKLAEDALLMANRKLNLLSNITRHDINNQITALEGHLDLLEKKQPLLASNEHLKKAERAAGQISAMIEFTKAYEDIGVNAPTWQDVRTMVGSSAMDVPLGQIKVINEVPAGTEVFADPLIVKVFHNLIHNAVRHGGNITTIQFSIIEQDGHRTIICEDDGIGIPEDFKDKLFTKGYGKDHGLGLFLSREILAITGITINEMGEPRKGARFVMTVPLDRYREA